MVITKHPGKITEEENGNKKENPQQIKRNNKKCVANKH